MPKKRVYHHKQKVLSLVDRDTGQKRSIVVDNLNAKTLISTLRMKIAEEAHVMTDEEGQFKHLAAKFTGFGTSNE